MGKTCTCCGSVLERKERESPRDFNNRKYCNLSCRATHINFVKFGNRPPKLSSCQLCDTSIELKPQKGGGYTQKKYCDQCRKVVMREHASKLGHSKATVHLRTKSEMFQKCKNWQSSRTVIRRHACTVYANSGKPLACHECGYSKHVEICHIIAVSKFPGSSLIEAINDPSNLVALCPNHHWEFDNGQLVLKSN
jgi:HNH endonuclease